MSPELNVYDFLKDSIEGIVDEESKLFGAAVLKDEYEEMPKDIDKGIRIGKATSKITPGEGHEKVEHSDVLIRIIFYVRIKRGEKQVRSGYRDKAIAMGEACAMLFFNDPRMGGRAGYVRPLGLPRGMDDTENSAYAIANLVVVMNESGHIDYERMVF